MTNNKVRGYLNILLPLISPLTKGHACGIIVAHNHASGNLFARQGDIALTNKLKEAGKFLEISTA